MAELSLPVTVVMSRRAAGSRVPELSGWAESLCAAASTFPGHLGHKVRAVRTDDGSTDLAIGLWFATSEDLVRWEQSDERAAALETGAELTQGLPKPLSLEDMDFRVWGEGGVQTPAVSRGRAAVIVWIGLFPPAVVMSMLLEPHTREWPLPLRTLLLTLILVPVVVLGTVPLLNRALLRWHRDRDSSRQNPSQPG